MEKLCFEKYRNHSILYGVLFVVMLALGILFGGLQGYFVILIGVFCFGSFFVYYLFCYFSYKKKCAKLTPSEGVIFNWYLRGKYNTCLSVKEGEKEYETTSYFERYDAEEMVGKKVSYVILDDVLLICEVLG